MGLPAPARNRCGASGQSGEASLVRFLNHFSQLVSQRALREEPVLRRSKEEGRGGGGQSHTPRSNLPGGSRHGSTAQSGPSLRSAGLCTCRRRKAKQCKALCTTALADSSRGSWGPCGGPAGPPRVVPQGSSW